MQQVRQWCTNWSLITISTIGSVHPVLNGNFAYGSSRAGANALTRQFAMDFAGEGIVSNSILVGAISTGRPSLSMAASWWPDEA